MQLSPIKAIELAASKIPDAVSLAQGIPSFPTPLTIKQFAIDAIQSGKVDKYSLTTGLTELREEISLHLHGQGLAYDPDSEIVVTAGSIEGITASILSITEAGDEIILPSPSYASYTGAIRLARCEPVYVPLHEDRNFDFQIELIESSITRKTKGILIGNPNNPTGTIYSKENIVRLVNLASQRGIIIISDEVYDQFYYTNHQHFSPAHISQHRDTVLRVCSFSKSYAMTGWRVGFVHGDAQRMKHLLKFHDAMVTCAPVVSQYAAIGALRHGAEAVAEFKNEFQRRRDFVLHALDDLSEFVDYQVPNAAYFVFPRIKDSVPLARESTRFAYDLLEKEKVAVVPGEAFGPSGEGHLRISYGREWNDLEKGMERFARYLLRQTRNRVTHHTPPHLPGPSLASTPSFSPTGKHLLLRKLAKFYLWRRNPLTIGIFGTRGKTTCKRVLVESLEQTFRVRSSILSHNTVTGLPLSILGISTVGSASKVKILLKAVLNALFGNFRESILILEFGASTQEEMNWLLSIVQPKLAVLMGRDPPEALLIEDALKNAAPQMIDTDLAPLSYEVPDATVGDSARRSAWALGEIKTALQQYLHLQ